MTRRRVSGAIAIVLFVWMLVLLFKPPTFTTSGSYDPAVKIACASVIAVGWPTDHAFLQHDDLSHWSDHQVSGRTLDQTERMGIAMECSDRRQTYLGTMALLAVPISVLAGAALRRR